MSSSLSHEGLDSTNPSLPVIQKTPHGDTVFYKNKYVYSKINPSKNITNTIDTIAIRPQTLIICISPILGYGLKELLQKLPPASFILGLEADENLMKLSSSSISTEIFSNKNFKLVRTTSIHLLLQCIHNLELYPFRRCIRIDMSAISEEYNSFYSQAICSIEMNLNQWWKNHITVMKLGRNYIKNFFHNIALLHSAVPLLELQQDKMLFVAGAGPSLDDTLLFLKKNRNTLYILAVDASVQTLISNGIIPDCILLVESQFWIEKMFIGVKNLRIPVIADLTARTQAIKISNGSISFFFTKYASSSFLSSFEQSPLKPYAIEPLGSVGLIALKISDYVSKNKTIFFSGLDFSWKEAYTHSKETNPAREIRNTSNRLHPNSGVFKTDSVVTDLNCNGEQVFTNKIMQSYALHAKELSIVSNNSFFNLSSNGLTTGFPSISEEEALSLLYDPANKHHASKKTIVEEKISKEMSTTFLDEQVAKLHVLRRFLTDTKTKEDDKFVFEDVLKECDFLYLHYPDSYKGYSLEKDFLKRIRIEIDYMIKTINYPSF